MDNRTKFDVECEIKIKEYYPMIYKFVYIQVKSKMDAQDITQEVFYKYLVGNIDFPNAEIEKSWLFTVASNICKNFWRSGWYKRILPMKQDFPELETTTLEADYEKNEQTFDVLKCVAKLPLKYREVIHLFYYEDMSIEKISKITGKNKSTIQTQLDRGRKMLKKMMKEKEV